MKVVAVVLTWNPTEHDRLGLLDRTVASLGDADRVVVVDNGSTDGTDLTGVDVYRNDGANTTSGYGTHLCLRVAAGAGADLAVVSDDDMLWRDGWRERLERLWAAAPDDLLVLGGHLEPLFPWNAVGAVHDGWVERASTGAASWTTTRPQRLVELGGRVSTLVQGTWDVPVCGLVRADGWRIGQCDLADHAGAASTWGNGTVGAYGWDVEPVRALIR